ncbi:MAG: choline-sulfatase, partial [Polyangiaceae bacterium]
HRPVISDLSRTSDNDRRRAMIWKKYKIIAYGDDDSFKLFDLEADPKETRDLATKDKKLFKEMRKRYEDTSKTIKDRCPKMRNKLRGKKRGRPC